MLERIKQKLVTLRELDKDYKVFGARYHTYLMRPCLTESEIQQFEAKHEVRLPEDYRNFLMYVGNGGAGPGYGLFPLARFKEGFLEYQLASNVDIDSDEAEDEIDFYVIVQNLAFGSGIQILHFGCDYFSILIVTGEERGKVWFESYRKFYPVTYSANDATHVAFLPWYEQWLDVHIDALRNNKPIQHDWAFGFFS